MDALDLPLESGVSEVRVCCLLTCFNRCLQTIKCLEKLFQADLPPGWKLHVILVDDGSTDGTSSAVQDRFPSVDIIQGNGALYWNGGMRCAFGAAMKRDFDAILWLNDDTELHVDGLMVLWRALQALTVVPEAVPSIVVGATQDSVTGKLSYGGLVARDIRSSYYFVNLPVSDKIQQCRTLNGNCVLIPAVIAKRLGNLEEKFVHAIGDWDYGLRATAAGFGVWQAPGFVGTCNRNASVRLSADVARSVRARLRRVCSAKFTPPRAWLVYVRRHCGFHWPLEFAKPYVSAVISALRSKMRLDRG